jgi:hypothetical protein
MKAVMTLMAVVLILVMPPVAVAQTTIFTYQGELTDSGAPQATYQMRFRLFDALASGGQVGGTIENASVAVSDGIFTVALDFGAPVFNGADRFLEIAVRRNGGEGYTVLSPRQQIASSPYSIRTLSAQTADMALDSEKLGGLDASEYVTNATVGGSFINNGTTLQDADFNIDGNGIIGGFVGVRTGINPNFSADIYGGTRIFSDSAAHVVTQTTGGTNTWARFYMRTPSQSWFMGTSQNFSGNQFYLADETSVQTRMTIQPFGGAIAFPLGNVGIGTSSPGARLAVSTNTNGAGNNTAQFEALSIGPNASHIHYGTNGDWYIRSAATAGKVVLQDTGGNVGIGTQTPNAKLSVVGSVTQDHNSRGLPKAMIFVLANGTISRCYNGTNGSNTSGCGFSVIVANGLYSVNFGFDISQAFFSLSTYGNYSEIAGRITSIANATAHIFTFFSYEDDPYGMPVPSDFFLLVY